MRSTIIGWSSCLVCVVVVSMSGLAFGQTEAVRVSPGVFSNMEGNGQSQAGRAGRIQFLYPASDFEAVPQSHRFIRQFAWRPDVANQFDDAVSGPVTFRLSTTTATSLTSSFENNLGPDETVVYQGDLTWQTDNDPPQGPRDFDYSVTLDQPFEYGGGNIILDFMASTDWSNTSGWYIDIHRSSTGPITAIGTTNPNAASASFSFRAIYPAQFTFAPGLADVNLDGVVNGLDVDPFVGVLLNGPYQPEADMNEDGDVNGLDVDPFVAAVVGGDTQQIPEPSTLILTLTALAAVGGWRKWHG